MKRLALLVAGSDVATRDGSLETRGPRVSAGLHLRRQVHGRHRRTLPACSDDAITRAMVLLADEQLEAVIPGAADAADLRPGDVDRLKLT